MRYATSFRALLPAVLIALIAVVAGCQRAPESADAVPSPYDGKYKNAKGAVVLEIKEGRALFTNPTTGAKSDTSFSPSGNDLLVESSSGTFTLKFDPPDSLSGLPVAIAGDAGPLKKVQ